MQAFFQSLNRLRGLMILVVDVDVFFEVVVVKIMFMTTISKFFDDYEIMTHDASSQKLAVEVKSHQKSFLALWVAPHVASMRPLKSFEHKNRFADNKIISLFASLGQRYTGEVWWNGFLCRPGIWSFAFQPTTLKQGYCIHCKVTGYLKQNWNL